MRIHSNVITIGDIYTAASNIAPGVAVTVSSHRSRTHNASFEVQMTGNGAGTHQYKALPYGTLAATWDEWGVLIGRLYVIDPEAVWGNVKNPIYASAEHFHWSTGGRFAPGTPIEDGIWTPREGSWLNVRLPADTHKRHKWNYAETVVTGAYHVAECKGSKGHPCSAIRRYMAYGRTFDEISSNAGVL
jgi:hypothetical protein